jgi:hypothetical protein
MTDDDLVDGPAHTPFALNFDENRRGQTGEMP